MTLIIILLVGLSVCYIAFTNKSNANTSPENKEKIEAKEKKYKKVYYWEREKRNKIHSGNKTSFGLGYTPRYKSKWVEE